MLYRLNFEVANTYNRKNLLVAFDKSIASVSVEPSTEEIIHAGGCLIWCYRAVCVATEAIKRLHKGAKTDLEATIP